MTDKEIKDRSLSIVKIIQAVRTPLGFFTLVVLVIEAFMIYTCKDLSGSNLTLLIVGMIGILLLLVLIVGITICFYPESLFREGKVASQPEDIMKIINHFKARAEIAAQLAGSWEFTAYSKRGEDTDKIKTRGNCNIVKSDFHLYIEGNWIDENDQVAGSWFAGQIFLDERELTYVFEVPETPGVASLGVTKVRLIYSKTEGNVSVMRGNWGILSQNVYGKIEFKRKRNV
jgi:hypothetical protein